MREHAGPVDRIPVAVHIAEGNVAADSAPAPLNVLVLGMHRSGTSAVAEALRAAGIEAGDQSALMDLEPQNPMGFGERLDVALFNDRLLASLEWFWDAPDSVPLANPPARPEFVAEGRALVQRNLAGPRPFMLKDPRISLLLPWWRQILLDRFVPVVVLRDPAEVAWSLSVRDGYPIELGLALWAAYHRHLAAGLDGMEWIAVDYAGLCDKPRAAVMDLLKSLAALGVEGTVDSRAAARTIRPLLRRATQPREIGADPEAMAAIGRLRAQWPNAPVSTARSVEPTQSPAEWEKAILRVHRRTREANAREEAARTSLAELDARFATLAAQHAEAERVAGELREDASTLRRGLEGANRDRDAARTRLTELETILETVSRERRDLEARLEALSTEHAELRRGTTALGLVAEEAERERDAARNGVADLETRLATLGSEHTDLDRAATALRAQVENLSREGDAARSSLAKLERAGEKQRSKGALLRQQVRHVEGERDAALSRSAELETRLSTLDAQHNDLNRVATELRGEGALLRQQLDHIGRGRDAARASLIGLEERFGSLTIEHRELESRIATLLAERVDFARVESDLRENIDDRDREAVLLRADGAALRLQVADAKSTRDGLAVERNRLASERDQLRFRRDELIRHAAAADERQMGADAEIHVLRVKAGNLESQLAAVAAAEAARAMQSASSRLSIRWLVRAVRRTYRLVLVHLPQKVLGRVWHNPLFDSDWYLEQNPDIRATGIRPELHYRLHGISEARNPNPLFETAWYLGQSSGVSRSGLNPLDHYLFYGAAAGRDPSPQFSAARYVLANPDVAANGMNPLLHYLRFGLAEGRPTTLIVPAPHESTGVEWAGTPAEGFATTREGSTTPVGQGPTIARHEHSDPRSPVRIADDVRVIAMYRSSYYPHPKSPTNGEPISSEWLTVVRARPTFANHRQPHVPGELGFYDLRLPDTRHDQSELARAYGIHAFCYYEAWGYPSLHTEPFREMLASGQPDFPFTLCLTTDPSPAAEPAVSVVTIKWLNANRAQVESALVALLDGRAVTVGIEPVLLVEGLGGSAGKPVTDFLRKEALRVGLPGIFLVAPTAATDDADAAHALGVDALLAMHPNRTLLQGHGAHSGNGRSPHGSVLSYEEYVKRTRLVTPSPLRLQTVLCGWDDTPLNGHGGLVLTDATPEAYSEWLRSEVSTARDLLPRDRRFVFVSSWNDWARGAHLEPDTVNGRAYLESTRATLASPLWAVDEPTR